MDKFVVIEVGSTNTKSYLYKNGVVKDLGVKTIEFKNNYKRYNKIVDNDKRALFDFIDNINEKNIFVFGTSIFRELNDYHKKNWLEEFESRTGLVFNIVTSDMENEYTVYGVVSNIDYDGKIAVMIGGGGSIELSIVYNRRIIEKANSSFGAMDITDMFPDLREDNVVTDYDYMLNRTKELINIPSNKADLLVLAGGDYIYYYEELGYPVEENKFYQSELQPYSLDVELMDKLDKNFFYEVSLEEVCHRTNNDRWWRGARGMRLCVRSFVDILDAKYIIPTRISMVYGIVEKIRKNELNI